MVDGLQSGALTRSLESSLNTTISGVAVAEPQPDPASEEWADIANQNVSGKEKREDEQRYTLGPTSSDMIDV